MAMSQEFTPGDRVMVSEGYPGVVMDVSVGIDTTHYWVELEDEQGQGWWSENEMTPASLSATASHAQEGAHEAVESYPELGDILTSRPDYVLSLPEEEYQRLRLQGKVASRKESIYLPLDLSPSNRGEAYKAGYSDGYDGMQSQDRGKTAYSSNYLLGWADGIRDRHAPDALDTTQDLQDQEPNLPEMNFVPDRFDPVHASIKEAALSDIIDFVKGDPTPTDYWAGPGKNWSYDWCRFRRDSTCYFPKELDRPASNLAGYAVWVPEDRGHCRRQSWESQEACPMPSQPGPNVPGGFTDATVPWSEGGQRGGVPSRRVASRADIGDGMAFHYISAWADVQAKGKRIYDDGGVRVLSVIMQPDGIRPEIFVAQVQGDNKVYQVQMDFVPGTFKVGAWHCECPWNSYNWGRRVRPEWEGRACSHFMAAMYAMQSQGMSGMPDSEDAIAPEWVPKAASAGPLMAQDFPDVYALLRNGSPVSQVQALMAQSGIETQSSKTHFKGTVNGQVVDLDFEDGRVYYLGEEYLGEVIHPDYHPTRGLVASKIEQEDDMSVSNDEWLFSGPGVSTSELRDEPEPALPTTTAEEEPEEDLLGESLSVPASRKTAVTLDEITHDGPVRVRERGQGGEGIDWTVQPENFPRTIEMINQHGGPDFWEVTPVEATKAAARAASRKTANYDTEVVERGPGDFWVLVKGPVTVDGVTIDSAVIKSFGPYRDRETAERFASYDLAEVKTSSRKIAAAFSAAEQDQIINEGEGVTARNLGSLSLEGTHYLALEPMLTEPGLDDDTISW